MIVKITIFNSNQLNRYYNNQNLLILSKNTYSTCYKSHLGNFITNYITYFTSLSAVLLYNPIRKRLATVPFNLGVLIHIQCGAGSSA